MKKFNLNPNSAVYMAIVTVITAVWVITLFLLMWYDKQAVRIANTDYVREVTRWPGHTHVKNIPVEYKLYSTGSSMAPKVNLPVVVLDTPVSRVNRDSQQ